MSHVNFSISFSRPLILSTEQKAQTESGKRSLPTKKELSSRHLCLQKTDQSYVQDSANFAARQVGHAPGNAQEKVSTCNATILRGKLKENVARITEPLTETKAKVDIYSF